MAKTRIIKIEGTDKRFSKFGGIFLYNDLVNDFNLAKSLRNILPQPQIKTQSSSFDKFTALLLGFIAGAQCLEDMEEYRIDSVFNELLPMNAGNVYGDYLREFTNMQCKELNLKLTDTALDLRFKNHSSKKLFTLDIDSTPHIQYGRKIEGVEYNYDGKWCLDSINAYDELGFQYFSDVRNGATFSSNGASEIIHNVFKKLKERLGEDKYKRLLKYFRGDSAFCNNDCFNACRAAEISFVVSMRENMYRSYIPKIDNWEKVDNTDRKKKDYFLFHDGREVELGSTAYFPAKGSGHLRMVAMRALRPGKQESFFEDNYDYFVAITNISSTKMQNEKLIRFYRKRGNAENFIKEMKYSYDLKHFPCQKLTANKAYGLISAYAYNLMRYTAHIIDPVKVPYAKRIRNLLVYLPCQVIKHARSTIFQFNERIYREVMRFKEKLHTSSVLIFEN